MKMSELVVRFAAVVCLFVCLGGQSSARVRTVRSWPPTLPPNSNDPYYQAFQNVSSPDVTASKLMAYLLHFYPRIDLRVYHCNWWAQDIVVVMDGSGSIPKCEFEKGKKALKHMMNLASVSTNHVKYATVTFADSAVVNFKILPYCAAANEIMKIPYPGGSTNTQAGLAEAKKLFDDSSSGRRDATKIVFLVTDGQSNVENQLTIPKAQELKDIGAWIYVVAVGNYISGIDELVKVASYPPEQFVFRVKSLQGFWNIIKLVIKQVSPDDYAIIIGQNDPSC